MRKVTSLLLISALLLISGSLRAQCEMTSSWGSATVNTEGMVTTISTCNYTSEYSTVSGIIVDETYEFACALSGTHKYVTLRDAASGGAVLAHGPSPLTWVASYSGMVYPHWSDDAACTSTSSCHVTTVQWTSWTPPACPPPSSLTANNLTTTTADLGWTPDGDEESEHQIRRTGF